MCRADGLTPQAENLVGDLMTQIKEALGRKYSCDPAGITVGPVDIGPEDLP